MLILRLVNTHQEEKFVQEDIIASLAILKIKRRQMKRLIVKDGYIRVSEGDSTRLGSLLITKPHIQPDDSVSNVTAC